ncbi:arabinofuranosyltransferase [Striga asiatica]|uniref:Arabinofuranosyltransferase n=1 Tax=Striga asiatica TaxID=4170 RepID=A0A5A7QBG2_STRAF|nr:arabinofuranosyltransferase [Striga asiatica]
MIIVDIHLLMLVACRRLPRRSCRVGSRLALLEPFKIGVVGSALRVLFSRCPVLNKVGLLEFIASGVMSKWFASAVTKCPSADEPMHNGSGQVFDKPIGHASGNPSRMREKLGPTLLSVEIEGFASRTEEIETTDFLHYVCSDFFILSTTKGSDFPKISLAGKHKFKKLSGDISLVISPDHGFSGLSGSQDPSPVSTTHL